MGWANRLWILHRKCSFEASRILRHAPFKEHLIQDGFKGWVVMGWLVISICFEAQFSGIHTARCILDRSG